MTDKRTLHLAEALIDPVKRAKLIMISGALGKEMKGIEGMVYYGYLLGKQRFRGEYGFSFKEIAGLLQ